MKHRSLKFLMPFAVNVICSFVFAQDLTSAKTLVETWRTSLMPADFDSVQISVAQTFSSGEIWSIEQFYDFRKDVVHSTTEDTGVGSNTMIFRNGKLEANMTLNESVSPEQLGNKGLGLITWFSAQLAEFRIFIPRDYEIVSYEGKIQYGDFAKGEQVTLSYLDVKEGNQLVTRSFIFSDTGELIATFEQGQGQPLLTVLEIFGFDDYVRVKATAYASDGQNAVKVYELREDYQFNKAFEATPFAFN